MDLEALRHYLLERPGATEDQPFGPDVVVYRIGGKIFAIIPLERFPHQVNLKCLPDRCVELREKYESVLPGYHMNKTHWNTVLLAGDVPDSVIRILVDHSYELVLSSLPARTRALMNQT